MSFVTVWCVCTGDKYHSAYVYALKEAVEKHLTVPHDFKCITKRKLEGINTVTPYVPYQGWWSKLSLFSPSVATGPSIYFDLDVVITGSLDYLVEYAQTEFAAPANWARSGHGGIQSSVMAWRGNWFAPFEYIKPQWPAVASRLWGDQELLWEMLGDNWIRIPRIYSYKYHCQTDKRPDDMSVCVFHGEPKPIDARDEWLLPYTLTLRNGIKSSMGYGWREALSVSG